MAVTVLSKPSCVQCTATKRALTKAGVDFTEVDMSENPDALDRAKSLGYLAAPVVIVDENTHWAGYQPDKISALAAA